MTQRIPAEAFPLSDFIKEELDARGWSQADLAKIIGRSPKAVHSLVSGKVPLTPETATLLADAFGTSPEYWMNLETAYKSWQISRDVRQSVSRLGRLYEVAPVREMQRRGWISRTEDISTLEAAVFSFFDVAGTAELISCEVPHAARMSNVYGQQSPHLLAWLARARNLARAVKVATFSESGLSDCLARLRLLTADPEEVRHVPRILAEHGIRFLVVEQLPQTKIDGACLWLDEHSPVVVLTMRFDRLDWFWFTLLHELGHVKARDGQGIRGTIDSELVGEHAVAHSAKPEHEQAADRFAANALVPKQELDNFIARIRPLYSKERIRLFAKRIGVHPGLVVGQLQFRGEIPYYHSREMLRDRVRDVITANAITDGWGNLPLTV